jgi:DNA-binding response OmpR family regulator
MQRLNPAPTNQERARSNPRVQKSILVVEDNDLIAQALGAVLSSADFAVTRYANGLDAMRHVAESRPDAAIIDIHLPDINGLVLTQRLRDRLGEQTPLLVLSGDTSIQTINSLPHVGATYFFPKPVQGGILVERLREWLA